MYISCPTIDNKMLNYSMVRNKKKKQPLKLLNTKI